MFKKKLVLWILFAVIVALIIGYVGLTNSKGFLGYNKTPSNLGQNANSGGSPSEESNGSGNGVALINTIVSLAKQGKVINSVFAAKVTVIEDVEKAWGKPDKMDYVAQAKGTYATYEKQGVVFGFNKGLQIFEVRSYDSGLKTVTLKKS